MSKEHTHMPELIYSYWIIGGKRTRVYRVRCECGIETSYKMHGSLVTYPRRAWRFWPPTLTEAKEETNE